MHSEHSQLLGDETGEQSHVKQTFLKHREKKEEEESGDMTLSAVQQLFLLCLFICFGCWSTTDASPLDQWEDGIVLQKVRGIRSDDLSGVLRRDQNEEQVQNVFKRFLFHYSKARNSVGAVQKESHSVHPLMRLSPKLSQRRKKKVVLLVRTQI
ncbi:neuromedin-S [Pundamilia nyererei]|uniref:Neuromedin-S n=1 Tax=Pundamilia nyererei TaxID=303518 RepID=A0A9Y3RTT0_9CICH|nr:PREDICTED: neuromedin-S-like [Pundamilia nyererei]